MRASLQSARRRGGRASLQSARRQGGRASSPKKRYRVATLIALVALWQHAEHEALARNTPDERDMVRSAFAQHANGSGGASSSGVTNAARLSLPEAEANAARAASKSGLATDAGLPTEPARPSVPYAHWQGTSFGAYMAPVDLAVDESGGYDLAFHFHAAFMAEKEWQAAGANVVVASATFGIGSGYYVDAFASPARFGQMLGEITAGLQVKRPVGSTLLHVRRVTLVAWSAGFGAVSTILGQAHYYDQVDSVVLLDGIHASYTDANGSALHGADKVSVRGLAQFIRFAADARDGKKVFVVTHSSIVPPDYASTTEASSALLREVGVERSAVGAEASNGIDANVTLLEESALRERKMTLTSRADAGDLHVRGFSGKSQGAHIDHLHLAGTMMRNYVVPFRERLADPSALPSEPRAGL